MNNAYLYDVAISFAEEDKDIACKLSLALEAIGLKSYYYPDNRSVSFGQVLEESLTRIYSKDARYAIVLFSESYLNEDKIYTKIELAAIQNRMKEDSDIVYMLPIRLNKEVSLEEYPEINKITYIEWNENYKEISIEIKKLLGKGLISSDGNTNSDNIVYSYGEGNQSLIVEGINTGTINQRVFNTTNKIYVLDKDLTSLSKLLKPNKTNKHLCPHCSVEIVVKKEGITKCNNCNEIFVIENVDPDTKIKTYVWLNEEETILYNKIRARIRNSINDKNYELAYQYCLKAEEIAPGEVSTWKHFAITVFLLQIYKPKSDRSPSFEIIKLIKPYLEKCLINGMMKDSYNSLLIYIANNLFAIEKSRINSYKSHYKDDLGYEKWTRQDFYYLQTLLRSFEICYNLNADILCLEEYVKELAKPNKWIVKDAVNGVIKNTKFFNNFNAYEKFKFLVNKIKEQKKDYIVPEIEKEIFIILSSKPSEEENEPFVGDDNNDVDITIKLIN